MATLEYIKIPPGATRLQAPPSRVQTSLPSPSLPIFPSTPTSSTLPSRAFALLPQAILPNLPATFQTSQTTLLSARDPLSLHTTTVNFRRFVARSGPIFWIQDRLEEVLFWKAGWKRTTICMTAYSFFCYYPRMVLLIPNISMIIAMLAAPAIKGGADVTLAEGSAGWLANMQGIQNLMGFVADVHDSFAPLAAHLSLSSTTHARTASLLLVISTLSALLITLTITLPTLPLRLIFLILGLAPFVLTHPSLAKHAHVPLRLRTLAQRFADNDRLSDACWRAPMREVELWENERWSEDGAWSKGTLRSGERAPWTRGHDGWSGAVSSNLTFALPPRWAFVPSEDWRVDLCAGWAEGGGDDDGWVYMNDSWLEPRAAPAPEWTAGGKGGMTRQRRWVRRIWYDIDAEESGEVLSGHS